MSVPSHLIEKEILHNTLTSLGNIAALEIFFDIQKLSNDIQIFKNEWKPYNPRKAHIPRFGLSLTSVDGSLSGIPDLDSLREYNREHGTNHTEGTIRTPTPVLKELSCLNLPLESFLPHLGRSHLIRFNEGGHFPYHRDSYGLGDDCFRLIALLNDCNSGDICFVYDRRVLKLDVGQLYFMNTRIEHAFFSFKNNATILVLNVLVSSESADLVFHHLQAK